MTTAEKIIAELRTLPEAQAQEVLESNQQNVSAFDRSGAVYEGRFSRDEIFDRKVLR